MTNQILEELHATRAKLVAEAGDDLHRYVEEAKKRALASGRPIAKPVRRTNSLRPVNVGVSTTDRPFLDKV